MPNTSPLANPSCIPKSQRPRSLSLPVLPTSPDGRHADRNAWEPGHTRIQHSRAGKWRAAVLITVHVIMAVHIVQWLVMGLTLSPVEPSESMYTLRDGLVNAGFVFFALAMLSTFVFGRFFCGWGCHIVAVQDLCSWIMMRLGLKPRPFRSRLLLLVPVGLAIYMFAWPVVAREVVHPLLADERGRLPDWLGQADPLAGVRSAFLVKDFWATFAQWYIAIPFVLTCAVATVYFLGAKAFCTYGCPYGGIFGPADLLAVGKIRVTDACHHCGHCTAVCTSNVRVHEEVRDFGMVVDPGCMKCMDCVSVCPNDALYFGLGKPAILAKVRPGAEESAAKAKALRQARYDLAWPEEIVVGALFVVLFLCYRGMLNQVPMLMAVAMGGLGAWAVWKCWRLLMDANSRVHGFQLKYRGKLRPWGYVFAACTLACIAIAAWSGYVRWTLFRAQLAYQKLEVPIGVVLRPDFAPAQKDGAIARVALDLYKRGSPPSEGGTAILWPLLPDEVVNVTYLQLVVGDDAAAERSMQRIIDSGHPKDSLVFQLAQVMNAQTQRTAIRMQVLGVEQAKIDELMAASANQIEAMLVAALAKHDELMGVRDRVLRRRVDAGDKQGAVAEWSEALARHPHSADALLAAAGFYLDTKDLPAARSAIDRALGQHGLRPDQLLNAARLLDLAGNRSRAIELTKRAADEGLKLPGPRAAAAQLALALGAPEEAERLAERAAELARAKPAQDGRVGALNLAGQVLLAMNKPEKGLVLIREAADLAGPAAWDLAPLGTGLVSAGAQMQRRDLVAEGVRIIERARDANPNAPSIRVDLAQAYRADGRHDDALRELKAADELAPGNALIAETCAEWLQDIGQGAEAVRWHGIAVKRAAAGIDQKP